MKKLNLLIVALLMITIYVGCKKKEDAVTTVPPTTAADNYASMAAFHAQNGVPMQTFTINAVTGGSFTTPQRTVVTIPANAFQTQAGGAVTGNVLIQFKDIYKKSDMLLSDKTTPYFTGIPMKSGGEFFIKAMQANVPVIMATGKKISVSQPISQTGVLDTAMAAMQIKDTASSTQPVWVLSPTDSINQYLTNYMYSFYSFTSPLDTRKWSNSDDCSFFSTYTQTTLTMHSTDIVSDYNTEIYLFFTGVNSTVHVYSYGNNFPYSYAPVGLQCTAIAIGVKNGKLYSSFTPITITNNLTVNFTLSETTTADFKTRLNTLN